MLLFILTTNKYLWELKIKRLLLDHVLDTKKKRDVSTDAKMNDNVPLNFGVNSNTVSQQHIRRKRSISKYLYRLKLMIKTTKIVNSLTYVKPVNIF